MASSEAVKFKAIENKNQIEYQKYTIQQQQQQHRQECTINEYEEWGIRLNNNLQKPKVFIRVVG